MRFARDAARTRFIEGEGYKILRFWNHDVLGNVEGVLQTILEALNQAHPRPLPQAGGEEEVFSPVPQAGGEEEVFSLVPQAGGEDEAFSPVPPTGGEDKPRLPLPLAGGDRGVGRS